MSLLPVIFEDHTLTGFRPHTWSQPVAELRCGLLNPRERVAHACGQAPALLTRTFLSGLATEAGHANGVEAVLAGAEAQGGLLLFSGRIGSAWDLIERAVNEAAAGKELAWRDADGWLVISVGADRAREVLATWSAWEDEAARSGCWSDTEVPTPAWDPPSAGDPVETVGAWRRIWDLVPATASALTADLEHLAGRLPRRQVWGAVPESTATWAEAVDLRPWSEAPPAGVSVRAPENVYLGSECDLAPTVAVDATAGPVILGRGVRVLPHAYLEGPLYIGSESLVKAGACIYGETSLGAVNKVAGEIGESTFLDLVNKAHEGFIGHAYVGSWSNLGALTTCSDLKNTYGSIRIDLGQGPEDSGRQFVGLLMGEHGKTAIGTLFNTGTTVGFSSNVFGAGFPAKCLPCFTWGDGRGAERQDPERAEAVASVVMARRGCRLTDGHREVFRTLAG